MAAVETKDTVWVEREHWTATAWWLNLLMYHLVKLTDFARNEVGTCYTLQTKLFPTDGSKQKLGAFLQPGSQFTFNRSLVNK